MIHENVELHNVVEAERLSGAPGVMLRRFPRSVRDHINPRGRFVSRSSTGCEVRFVSDAQFVRATFFCLEGDGEIYVYCGDFFHSLQRVQPGTQRVVHLEWPSRFSEVKPQALRRNFDPKVWRFVPNRTEMSLVSVDCAGYNVRPPHPNEKPAKRWIALGSSITHSHCAYGYPHVAAMLLGVDVLNLGLGGSCHAETVVSDFLASRDDWDVMTCELGINMRNAISTEEFRIRAKYMVDRLIAAHPTKPIAMINHFPTHSSHPLNPDDAEASRERAYDQTLRDIVKVRRHAHLHMIEGTSILDRFDALAIDLIHPTPVGDAMMGVNLAKHLA